MCYYKAFKLLPQDTVMLPWGRLAPTSIGSWYQLQRGMPSTRVLLATNHSLAERTGFAFQVCYPNRILSFTGSLAPSSILSIAMLLVSTLFQPLNVIACFSGGSTQVGVAEPE
nr:hypothetical protein DCGMS_00390, mitochondrial [Tanacetum cinerariifolium]